MLRSLFTRPRTIRVPLENGEIKLQRVQVTKKSRPMAGQFLVKFVVGYVIFKSIKTFMPHETNTVQKTLHEDKTIPRNILTRPSASGLNQGPASLGSDQIVPTEESDDLYITLPVRFRKRYIRTYKSTDPEYQVFLRFQGDKARVKKTMEEVSRSVGKQLQQGKHQANLKHIGYKNMAAVWLDVVPPIWRPPVVEVLSFELYPKFGFSWRPVPEHLGGKYERVFHPFVVSQALYHGLFEFVKVTYWIGRARFNDTINQIHTSRITVTTHKGTTVTSTAINKDSRKSPDSEESRVKASLPMNTANKAIAKRVLPISRGSATDTSITARYDFIQKAKMLTFSDALEHSAGIFRYWIGHHQSRAIQTPDSTTCQIRGHIDFLGHKGRYRVEVKATFDPEKDMHIGQPMITNFFIVMDLPAVEKLEDLKRGLQRAQQLQAELTAMREDILTAEQRLKEPKSGTVVDAIPGSKNDPDGKMVKAVKAERQKTVDVVTESGADENVSTSSDPVAEKEKTKPEEVETGTSGDGPAKKEKEK